MAEGLKLDAGKPRWDLLPFRALDEVAKVLEFGARKYAPDNWRKVDGWRWRYLGAALRHLAAFGTGERLDRESGLHHLAHAACCVLFLLELDDDQRMTTEEAATAARQAFAEAERLGMMRDQSDAREAGVSPV